jgi:hypothetical protein
MQGLSEGSDSKIASSYAAHFVKLCTTLRFTERLAIVVKANLWQNRQKGGTGQGSFSGLFLSFSRLTRQISREVVGETGGPWDGTLPKVCLYYGSP